MSYYELKEVYHIMSQRILNRRGIARFKRQEAPIPVEEEEEEDVGISMQGGRGYRKVKQRPRIGGQVRRSKVGGQTTGEEFIAKGKAFVQRVRLGFQTNRPGIIVPIGETIGATIGVTANRTRMLSKPIS